MGWRTKMANGTVCKTVLCAFDSHRHLQFLLEIEACRDGKDSKLAISQTSGFKQLVLDWSFGWNSTFPDQSRDFGNFLLSAFWMS